MELEKEHAILQYNIDKQRAEAERNLLGTTLERERMQATSTLEQVKLQSELFAKILSRPATNPRRAKLSWMQVPDMFPNLSAIMP